MKEVQITYEEFQDALLVVKKYKRQVEKHLQGIIKESEAASRFANITKETKINDTELSVRCRNLLYGNQDFLGIEYDRETRVKELSKLSINKFLSCWMVGELVVEELKELCALADVKLLR